MKKIVKLTETDLTKLVKRVIKEDEDTFMDYEDRLNIIEGNLDEIKYLFSRIEDELLQMEEEINDDDNLDDDEKEGLMIYAGDLYRRCTSRK